MKSHPLRTTVIGSYPFPAWLEFATNNLEIFGKKDREELINDAVCIAMQDQIHAGLDVITDGEQTRLDFNLSFYGFLEGIELESESPRNFGPPAHDQRGKHAITGTLKAPAGLGAVEDFKRLQSLCPAAYTLKASVTSPRHLVGVRHSISEYTLKASVPGPYTLSGRLIPNEQYPDRYAISEALLPIVRSELKALMLAGCTEITVDEPSMSCYAHKEDPDRFVDIFNRTVEPVVGKCHLSTHLCFGNYKGRAVGPRQYAPMFPAFMGMHVDELHLEMASREFAELEIIEEIAKTKDVAVGIVDVKSYYIESADDIAERVRRCLQYAPPERLSFAPDCGLSQTARWAAKQKLANMVAGVHMVRKELGI